MVPLAVTEQSESILLSVIQMDNVKVVPLVVTGQSESILPSVIPLVVIEQ